MKSLTDVERVLAAREGGNVSRCHVVPHHGEYTVGNHSYHAVSMLMILHPNPSKALMWALLWHDNGERWVGDMPATAKWMSKRLCKEYEAVEQETLDKWEFSQPFGDLTGNDKRWLNAIDKLELWVWSHEQLAMGNTLVADFITRLDDYFVQLIVDDQMPYQCITFRHKFEFKRLPDRREEV